MQKNYYAILPARVRYAKNIPAAGKLFYAEITALTNAAGYCFASNKYFTELYGVSERTIRDWLAVLKAENMVTVQLIKDGKKQVKERRIYLVDPGAKNCPTPTAENCPTPPAKNCRDNNIGVNSIDTFIINNKRDNKNLNKELKAVFIDLYDREKPAPYYWTAKDAGSLAQLSNKIRATLAAKNDPAAVDQTGDDKIIDSFKAILGTLAKDPNSWLFKNLSISLINSQFNQIISNYGTQHNTRQKGYDLINAIYGPSR